MAFHQDAHGHGYGHGHGLGLGLATLRRTELWRWRRAQGRVSSKSDAKLQIMQSEPKVGVAQIVGKLKGQQIDPLQRDWKGVRRVAAAVADGPGDGGGRERAGRGELL